MACAGRTDSGVHATNQIIHFDTRAVRSARNWVLGANSHLPPAIRLHWAHEVTPRFHARFSATSRTYRYLIANQSHRPALCYSGLTWEKHPLNIELMQKSAQHLLGEHDFSGFRGAGCQSRSSFRNVHRVDFCRRDNLVVMQITANAFLLHMVRNIVGSLLAVGRCERSPDWIAELLIGRDRTKGEATAPPNGLYLVAVEYPRKFAVPAFAQGPCMLGEGF